MIRRVNAPLVARVSAPDLLARIPYFRVLPAPQRAALARRLRSVVSAPRQRVFEEGAPCAGLPGTRDEIAARVGTVREPLSRALAALAREGLVTVRGQRLLVRDVKGLEDAAGGSV